jgi:hypothetical protein
VGVDPGVSTGHFRRMRGEASLAMPFGGHAGFAGVAVRIPHILRAAPLAVP